ncbi:MAG: protoheme IX farnesyltransferase [Planctomycetota bacterium]|nr:MAG: protoheme IX farnesyltransferase [Planctomycetota bacterium]
MIQVEKLASNKSEKGIWQFISLLIELGKVRITVMVTFTTAMGYILASKRMDFLMIYPLLGTFILASGSAALNHWQDSHIDQAMTRTKKRPLPSGRISNLAALGIAFLWIFLGSALLAWGAGSIPFLFGVLALLWYNGIYTYLKRQTSLAVIPGSIIGALPPLIGWSTVKPYEYSPQIIALAWYMFIWQIPHFWLILTLHYEDYGRAVWKRIPSKDRLKRWVLWGMAFTLASALLLFWTQLWVSLISQILFIVSFGLMIGFTLFYSRFKISHGLFFGIMNLYTLFLIIMVILENSF